MDAGDDGLRIRRLSGTFPVAAFCCILLATSSAQASLILGNLPSANDGAGSVFSNANRRQAAVFTVGPQDITLTDIIVRLNNYNSSTPQPDDVELGIFADGGAAPGAQIGSYLTAPTSATPSLGNFTFLPSGVIDLLANTRYWLVMSRGRGNFTWTASTDTGSNAPTGGLATFDFFRTSTNGGSSYTASSVANSFQMNGVTVAAAVPEPATMILMGVGVCALYLRRRVSRTVTTA